MGYYRKTCNYCGGNHSVMDCTKLQTDADTARANLLKYDDLEFFKSILKELIIYGAYEYDRENENVYYKLRATHTNPSLSDVKEIIKRNTWGWNRYARNEEISDYLSSEECEKFFCETVTGLKPNLTREQHDVVWENARKHKEIGILTSTIRQAEEASSSKAKRAKKSCSYCKETGHTARTCPLKKQHIDMHRKAHKIACYLTARACARFGLWTGSMVKTSDGIKVWAENQRTAIRFFKGFKIINDIDLLTQDQVDFIYLGNMAEDTAMFRKMGEDPSRYSYASRLRVGKDKSTFSGIDWQKNKLMDHNNEDSGDVLAFFPASIDSRHIYDRLVSYYEEPKPVNRLDGSPTIAVYRAKQVAESLNEGSRYGFWSSYADLFSKRQQNSNTWTSIQNFVEKNEHILNKITNEFV